MSGSAGWRRYWEEKSDRATTNFEFDRGRSPRDREIELLSTQELLEFVEPRPSDVVLDAGCGTGGLATLLLPRVRRLIGMDYSEAALQRCRQRVSNNAAPFALVRGDVTRIPLPARVVDKVLCMSVFQYLDDAEVRLALREAARVLRDNGMIVLHVKNVSSLYLSSLVLAKRLKRGLGRLVKIENLRTYRWYFEELRATGFDIVAYNSFNLLMIDVMPSGLVDWIRRLELRHHKRFPLRTAFLRRHGAELKIKARLAGRLVA